MAEKKSKMCRAALAATLIEAAMLVSGCGSAAPTAERMIAKEAVAVAAEDPTLLGASRSKVANGSDIKSIADILHRLPAGSTNSPGTKVNFELLNGKLKIDRPFSAKGAKVNFGEMNVYKTGAITGVGAVTCGSIASKRYSNCINAAALKLQESYFGEPDRVAALTDGLNEKRAAPVVHTP